MAWYNENWNKRFKITSDNTKVAASIKGLTYDLSNAPAGFWDGVNKETNDIPTDGLLSYWKFDENTGTVASDSHGTNTISLSGATWTTGKINSGLNFNGSNNRATFSQHRISALPAWSLSAWVYTPGKSSNAFYSDGSTTSSSNLFLIYLKEGSNDLRIYNNGGNIVTVGGYANFPSNTWVHIVLTYDGSVLRYYRDNTLIHSQTVSISNSGFDNMRFGNWYTQWFSGRIDEPAIYNRAINTTEINTLYNSGAGLQYNKIPAGSDIRITQSDEVTEVARDVVSIDTTTQTGQIRFDTSSIQTGVDTDYYLYFGNTAATEPLNNMDAYDASTVAYYTMDDTPNNRLSSNKLNYVGSPTYVEGKFDSGLRITTKAQSVYSDSVYNTTNISASKWYYFEGTGGNWNTIFCRDTGSYHHMLIQDGTSLIGLYSSPNFLSTGFSLVPNNWYKVTFTKAGNNHRIIVNGDSKGFWASTFSNVTYPLRIFANTGTTSGSQGPLGIHDETFVWNKELTVDEDLTLYNNESSNNTFWTTGIVEEVVTLLVMTNPATNITYTTVTFNGEIGGLE